MAARTMRVLFAFALLQGCASPALTLYTLAPPVSGELPPLGAHAPLIAVARISIPDALDTQDILLRDGDTLRRSATGRWAARLSLTLTDLVTARLAASRRDAVVTDQPQAGQVTSRLMIDVSQLDIDAAGSGRLQADWMIVPADPSLPVRRDRAGIVLRGPVGTDAEVVALMQKLSEALAARIAL